MSAEEWWRLEAPWDTLYYAEQKLKELGESAEWLALVEEVACGTRLTADEAWDGMADALRAYLDGIGSERVTSDGQSPQKKGMQDADRAREADTADVGEAARDEMPGMLRGGGADGRALHGGALLVRQDAPLRGPDGRRLPEGGAVLRVRLDDGAKLPERAHPTDAGADLFSPRDVTVPAHGSAVVDTGVHVELPPGTVGMLKSKSGLNVKHGIVGEGVIDEGYTGSVVVKLYNLGDKDITMSAGTKLIQLVVAPVLYPEISEADEIGGGPRGDAGFGSTGEVGRAG